MKYKQPILSCRFVIQVGPARARGIGLGLGLGLGLVLIRFCSVLTIFEKAIFLSTIIANGNEALPNVHQLILKCFSVNSILV